MSAELVYLDLTNVDCTRLVLEVHQIESITEMCPEYIEIRTKSGATYDVEQTMDDLLDRIGKAMALADGYEC